MSLTLGTKIAALGKGWRKIASREEIGTARVYAIVLRRSQMLGAASWISDEKPNASDFKYDDVYVIDSPAGK